jgi:hypothetical protein
MMILRRSLLAISFLVLAAAARAATFHIDSNSGNDSRSGLSPDQAWKTLERANTQLFEPGDQLLLKAGTTYKGQLKPKGAGAIVDGRPLPVTIGNYGKGPLPRIEAEGKYLDALLLRNTEFWEVQNLEITNLGTNRQPWQTGLRIVTDGFGKMRHIHIRNLYVHDVNGALEKSHEGCGIYFESRGGNESHFDDLLIEDCRVERTDRNGICQRTAGGARSPHVVIRRNMLKDIGGDGIKVWGSNRALIERNIVQGGRMRCNDYAAGIWPFASDDTLIQFNEVSQMKGTRDGQGFDSDYQCRRSVFQYNYSHDNEGGFFLICAPGNSYNEDTVIRYNVSQNDGLNSARVFHFGGGASNTWIYNNTIYVGPKQDLPLVLCTDWDGGNAQGTRFFNNIFYVAGRVTYKWGKSRDTVFENNVFCGMHVDRPVDSRAITNCPPLMAPGTAHDSFGSLDAYRFKPDADFPPGKIIVSSGSRLDFNGVEVRSDKPLRVGAIQ